MKIEKLTFENSSGQKLSARLELPETGDPVAYALFAHCFTCNKNLTAIRNISQGLGEYRIGVLSFDFTGLGESEGEFADTNFSSNVADLVEAAEYLAKNYAPPQILIGHSLGGAAVLRAAEHVPSARAVVTIGAPASPEHIEKHFQNSLEDIEERGVAEVKIEGRPFKIKKQLLEDIREQTLEECVHKLKKALLVLHSPIDNVVGINNATKIFVAAKHPKSFIGLDGADHLMGKKQDSLFAGQMIGAWSQRYLDGIDEDAPDFRTGHQVGVSTGEVPYTSDVRLGRHRLIADEPTSVGGQDQGPNPYDLLLAALGTCTSMTIKMYADRKKWPVKNIRVHLDHAKVHAEDCENCETKQGKIDVIDREVELIGDLDDAQRAKLMEIADKCPVHRTLHSEIKVRTSEAASGE